MRASDWLKQKDKDYTIYRWLIKSKGHNLSFFLSSSPFSLLRLICRLIFSYRSTSSSSPLLLLCLIRRSIYTNSVSQFPFQYFLLIGFFDLFWRSDELKLVFQIYVIKTLLIVNRWDIVMRLWRTRENSPIDFAGQEVLRCGLCGWLGRRRFWPPPSYVAPSGERGEWRTSLM